MTKIATYRYLNSLGGQYTSELDRCPKYSDIDKFVINGSYAATQLVRQSSIVKYVPDNVITVTATYDTSNSVLNMWSIRCNCQYPVASDLEINLGLATNRLGSNAATTKVSILSRGESGFKTISGGENHRFWYTTPNLGTGIYYSSIKLGDDYGNPINDGTYNYKLSLQNPTLITTPPIEFTLTIDRVTDSGWDNILPSSQPYVQYRVWLDMDDGIPTDLEVEQSTDDNCTLSNTSERLTGGRYLLAGKITYIVPETGIYPPSIRLYVRCSNVDGYAPVTNTITLYRKNISTIN